MQKDPKNNLHHSLSEPTIYLDESGNTGANLLDKEQPIFTMAGVNFSVEEANQLLDVIDSRSTKEVHFSVLKRRPSGQDAVVRMLQHSLINQNNVKVCLTNKPFMVTSKIVDILIEDMTSKSGFDLYENGANIALSNLLHYCLPTFCGEANVDFMYQQFISMVKTKDVESIESFYKSVYALLETCSQDSFRDDINMILATQMNINGALANVDRTSLDPLIPALFHQFISWGEQHPKGFHVIHDDSKTLDSQRQIYYDFMSAYSNNEVELGYDRRKFNLPLKGKSLNFSPSDSYPQLQVADVVSSAVSYWASCIVKDEKDSMFFKKLDELDLRRIIVSVIWPSLDVTPESLGTVHDGGINPADGSADFLSKVRASRPDN